MGIDDRKDMQMNMVQQQNYNGLVLLGKIIYLTKISFVQ